MTSSRVPGQHGAQVPHPPCTDCSRTLAEQSGRGLRRTVSKVLSALDGDPTGSRGGTVRAVAGYRKDLLRLLDAGQPLAACLFSLVDARVPPRVHASAFDGDEHTVAALLGHGRQSGAGPGGGPGGGGDGAGGSGSVVSAPVFVVAMELAARRRWQSVLEAGRAQLPTVCRDEHQPAVVAVLLRRCADLVRLDADLLAGALRDHCSAGALERDAALWRDFLTALPADLLPPLFEVRRFLGHGAEAARLAGSAAQISAALDCCLRSPRLGDAVAGVDLAERTGQTGPILRALREHTAGLYFAEARYGEALALYRAADRPHRVSQCLERLGRPAEALESCPADDAEAVVRLVTRLLPDVDAAVRRAEHTAAASLIVTLLGHLDRTTGGPEDVLTRVRADVAARRAALLVTGRRSFTDLAAHADTPPRRAAVDAELSRFEEAAEEWERAALAAERAGDSYRAHLLFRRAERFGQAERVLRDDSSPSGLAARAASARAGGDALGAARLYQRAGDADQAADLFASAGEYAAAAAALLGARGDAALTDPRLADHLVRAGDVDQLVRLCLRVLDSQATADAELAADSEAAADSQAAADSELAAAAVAQLRDLRARGQVPSTFVAEVTAALRTVDAVSRLPFETRASDWVAAARADVDRRFAGIWGLDLGTSTCSVAIYDTVRAAAVPCHPDGSGQFASTLSVDADGNEVIGLTGEEILGERVVGHISGAKRRMGTSTSYRVRDRAYRPEEVAARLIRHARDLVEDHLAAAVRERVGDLARAELGAVPDDWLTWLETAHDLRLSRDRAVLTIPAYFQNNQKHATRDACAIAGVEPVRLLHEPTAACMSEARQRGLAGEVVVVDLGAGTLDVSVLDVDDDLYEVRRVTGDTAYGGRDFDDAIRAALVERLERRGTRPPTTGRAGRRLTIAAEHLKISLSSRRSADYTLVGFDRGADVTLELDRAELARVLAGSLRVLREVCSRVRGELTGRPRHLVLVGGPMLSPVVRETVERVFDAHQTMVADPRTAVAAGAALLAAVLDGRLSERLLLDVTPLPLGIRAYSEDQELFSVVVDAGSTIPITRTRIYSTHSDNQTAIMVDIFNGSLETSARIGHFMLEGIRPAPAGESRIEVTFTLDASCVLEVSARDVATGQAKRIRVDDTTLLPPAQRDAMTRGFADQRDRERRAAEHAELLRRLSTLIDQARDDEPDRLFRAFEDLLADFRPPAGPLDTATQAMLAEAFNPAVRADVAAELRTVGQLLRDLARSATESVARAAAADDDEDHADRGRGADRGGGADSGHGADSADSADSADGADRAEQRHLVNELERALARRADLLAWVRRRTAVLESLAVRSPDPLGLFRVRFSAEDHVGALRALGDTRPRDVSDIRRLLRCLAEVGDVARYRSTLLDAADRLPNPVLLPSGQNAFAGQVHEALVAVTTTWPDGRRRCGRGFLVADRWVVTNRHWLTDPAGGGHASGQGASGQGASGQGASDQRASAHRAVAAPGAVLVGNERWGDRAVAAVHTPATGRADLVLLELRQPAPSAGLRLGHLRLLRLGERVWTADPMRPGTAEKFEHFPEDGLRLVRVGVVDVAAQDSGGPLFNELGEVVGVLTIPDRPAAGASGSSGVFALATDVLEGLLTAAGLDPLDLDHHP